MALKFENAIFSSAQNIRICYVHAGIGTAGSTLNDLYEYDVITNQWAVVSQTSADKYPSSSAYFGFAALHSKLYVYGGQHVESSSKFCK